MLGHNFGEKGQGERDSHRPRHAQRKGTTAIRTIKRGDLSAALSTKLGNLATLTREKRRYWEGRNLSQTILV